MDGFRFSGPEFPPGFRFHPTDQELIIHYLKKKVTSSVTPVTTDIIADVDLYKYNPWELPEKALFGEGEWFFFSPRDRKYPNGARPNRAAACGYWKATGTDKPILATGGSQCLGVKKALVFYKGRPPKGIKTEWVMHEYRLLDDAAASPSWPQKNKGSMRLDDWVLCRVRQKGIIPTLTDEKSEFSELAMNPNGEKQQPTSSRERNNCSLYEWSDFQLLNYLLGSQEEQGGESGGESSDLGSAKYSGLTCNTMASIGCAAAHQAQPPHVVSSVLDSIKRKLSFGALDELMLLPPGKRLHYSSSVDDQASPTGSASVDQAFPEFLV